MNAMATRRTALVTGASQGLGAAIAVALARDGFDVGVTELSARALDEVCAAVVSLASPGAAYITGQTLVLDGGLTAA